MQKKEGALAEKGQIRLVADDTKKQRKIIREREGSGWAYKASLFESQKGFILILNEMERNKNTKMNR